MIALDFFERILFVCGRIRPIWLKKKLFSFLHTSHYLVMRIYRILSQMRLPVFLVDGIGKTKGEPMKVLFIGKDHVPHFLFHMLFDKDPFMQKKGEIWIWNCSKIKQTYASEVEGIIVSCDRFFHRFLHDNGWFVLPHWVGMRFDSSKDLMALFNELSRSAAYDVKKVNKLGFSFTVTSDIKKISNFYHEMYLPTIESIIEKDEAYIADFLFFKLRYHKGYELMMISYKGEEIAGVFFLQKDEVIILEYAGVYHGDSSLIKKGAFSAFYYFFILLALERNVKTIDFGGTRPFFNDGLFQYKKKWGMNVEPYKILTDVTGFKMAKESDQFRRFLTDNPFIGINEKGELVGYVFVQDVTLDDTLKARFIKRYQTPGVKKIQFINL